MLGYSESYRQAMRSREETCVRAPSVPQPVPEEPSHSRACSNYKHKQGHANASMCLRGEGKELLGKRFSLLQLTVGSFRSFSFDFMCLELWRMGCIDASCGAFQTAVRTRDLHIVQLYMAPPASQFRNVMPIVNQAIKLHGESLGSFRAMSANPPASLHRKLSPHRKHELRMP